MGVREVVGHPSSVQGCESKYMYGTSDTQRMHVHVLAEHPGIVPECLAYKHGILRQLVGMRVVGNPSGLPTTLIPSGLHECPCSRRTSWNSPGELTNYGTKNTPTVGVRAVVRHPLLPSHINTACTGKIYMSSYKKWLQ